MLYITGIIFFHYLTMLNTAFFLGHVDKKDNAEATMDDDANVYSLKIKTKDNLIQISTNDPQGGNVDYQASSDLPLVENEWNFFGVTFNGDSSSGAIFFNE